MSLKVFISYKAEELSQAKWVKKRLEASGFCCWMAPESIPGGSNYAMEIPKAILGCDAFVVILSERAQNSRWVPKELDQAINAGKTVMPFIIENCPLRTDFRFYLANVQQYEAWKDRENAIAKLIRDIRNPLRKPGKDSDAGDFVEIKENENTTQLNRISRRKQEGNNRKESGEKNKYGLSTVTAFMAATAIVLLAVCVLFWLATTNHGTDTESSSVNEGALADVAGESEGFETDTEGSAAGNALLTEETVEAGTMEDSHGTELLGTTAGEDVDVDSLGHVVKYNTRGKVRILNKKYAQKFEFERLAARFEEESGIQVSVDSPTVPGYSEALEENITGSGSDPTLFMLSGMKDFEKYGTECLELTDCAAAEELVDDLYTLRGQNGKVYGLACIVESYGLCVNTRLLAKAGYEVSDIQSFADLKHVVQDITRRKDELGFSAFTSPSVGVGISGDYRFAEHAPAVPLYYELKDNDFNIGLTLRGTYLDCFRDYIDLYLDNAVVSRSQASSRSLEDAQKEFLLEKAVFHQDGSWNLEKIDAVMGDTAAVIPLYMGMPGEENQGLSRTSSYYWCVNKYASEDDIEATLQFLYWVVTSKVGTRIMTEDMGFQIPYRRADVPDNIFLETLHEQEAEGYEPINQYYKYGKYTAWTNSLMNAIKAYADGVGDWSAVEEAFRTLW